MKLEECKDVFALLSQYLDQELSPDLCEQIEAHIANCPPCVEFLESLKKTVALCKRLGAGERPVRLSDEHKRELLAAYRKALGQASQSGE